MAPKGVLCGRYVEGGYGFCRSCGDSPLIHVDQAAHGLLVLHSYQDGVLRKQYSILGFLAPWFAAGDPGALFYEEPCSPWWMFMLVCGMAIPEV